VYLSVRWICGIVVAISCNWQVICDGATRKEITYLKYIMQD